MHTHFENYSTQTALVYRHDGKQTFLPVVDERGHARPFAWGRCNVKWLFDTVPSNYSRERMGPQLIRFAAFWSGKNRVDLTQGQVVVLRRTLRAPVREWDPDCFVENQVAPWHDAAIISGPKGGLSIEWLEEPSPTPTGAGAPS
jgi:hypothetical protein